MTKFYVDQTGAYLGGFDGADPPLGAIEVPNPPARASEIWNGSGWSAATPTVADYTKAVQAMLDTEARAHNYDDVVSACSYAAAPNPFQAEGVSFVTWRGACWAKCYEIMADVQSGQRAQPSIAELLAMMPVRT